MRKSGIFKADGGATAIEYALIAALMFLVIIAAVTALGTEVQNMFTSVSSAMPK